MKIRLMALLLAVVAMAALAIVPAAKASEMDKKTVITVAGAPFEVPGGKVLPPGQYVIKRVDPSDPNIIGIWNADETKLFVTAHAIPVEEALRTGKVVLGMQERPGQPMMALNTWVYPGDTTGEQFTYPKYEVAVNGMVLTPRPGAAISVGGQTNQHLMKRSEQSQYQEQTPGSYSDPYMDPSYEAC